MRGKEKCRALKEIRRQIAEKNDIPYVVSQCTYQGDCRGTCPKCEAELRYLERELAIRKGLGKAVAVVGISTSVCAGLTACSPVETVKDALGIGVQNTAGATTLPYPEDIAGDVEVWPEPEQEGTEQTETQSIAPVEGVASEAEDETVETIPENTEALAGAIPMPTETEELEMGEILPTECAPEETVSELEGDIALPSDWSDSEESRPLMEEQTP